MKNNIKEYRTLRNITQIEMAKLLNVSRQTYINYESGIFEPPFETLIAISKILEISIDDLLVNEIYPSKRVNVNKKIIEDLQDLINKYK